MEWPYFELMDRILGHKPTTVPESVVDGLAQSQGNNDLSLEENKVYETLFGESSDTSTTVTINNSSTSTDASSTEASSTEPSSAAQKGKPNKKRKDQGETSLKW